MALLLEVASEKPGNVTPTRGFDDMTFTGFVLSSCVLGDVFGRMAKKPVGQIIHTAVTESVKSVGANAHLGAILLLAPLVSAYCRHGSISKGNVAKVLSALTRMDAELAYGAIRLANPGGLGKAPAQDVRKKPDVTLLEAMTLAAGRDWIAHEYAHGFAITLEVGAPELAANTAAGLPMTDAVIQTFLTIMNRFPDSLITRKNGPEMAREAALEAGRILNLGGMFSPRGRRAVYEFDQALRTGGNVLNPGTTADLTAAALFVYFIKHGYGALKIGKRESFA
jgi:triphosphoribosyl-dephospho-CoA synthase